jgi:hypothetical protein
MESKQASAFTDNRSQGQTLTHVIFDLATPTSGGPTPRNAHVALNCSESREDTRLLWNFDYKSVKTPADKHLVNKDAQLELLRTATRHERCV